VWPTSILRNNMQETKPNKETILIGVQFVLGMVPLLALNAWAAISSVSRLGSHLSAIIIICISLGIVILSAALLESALLKLPFGRCLKEASAVGWAFLAPNLFVFYWNLPKESQPSALILSILLIAFWVVFFWYVFSRNSKKGNIDHAD